MHPQVLNCGVQDVQDWQHPSPLRHKRARRRRVSDSCTSGVVTGSGKRSSALESLMDSLEVGMHEDDVVVPVHRYLPSIKVLPPGLLLPVLLQACVCSPTTRSICWPARAVAAFCLWRLGSEDVGLHAYFFCKSVCGTRALVLACQSCMHDCLCSLINA